MRKKMYERLAKSEYAGCKYVSYMYCLFLPLIHKINYIQMAYLKFFRFRNFSNLHDAIFQSYYILSRIRLFTPI